MKKAFKLFALALVAGALCVACGDDPVNPDDSTNPGGNTDQPGDPVLLEESFAAGIPTGWSNVDADGDGYSWEFTDQLEDHSGNAGVIYSASYINNIGALTPDNSLITPSITIPNSHYSLSWFVCPQDASYPDDKYSVYVGTNDNGTFNSIKCIYTETSLPSTWTIRTVDLSEFAGKTVCISFRHYDCTDAYYLKLDDVKVFDNTL